MVVPVAPEMWLGVAFSEKDATPCGLGVCVQSNPLQGRGGTCASLCFSIGPRLPRVPMSRPALLSVKQP